MKPACANEVKIVEKEGECAVQYEDTKPREMLLTFGSVVILFSFVILKSYKRAQTLTIPETFVAADMESRENR